MHGLCIQRARARFYESLLLSRRTVVVAIMVFVERQSALLAITWLNVVYLLSHIVLKVRQR
jgi:hypothetical protein